MQLCSSTQALEAFARVVKNKHFITNPMYVCFD